MKNFQKTFMLFLCGSLLLLPTIVSSQSEGSVSPETTSSSSPLAEDTGSGTATSSKPEPLVATSSALQSATTTDGQTPKPTATSVKPVGNKPSPSLLPAVSSSTSATIEASSSKPTVPQSVGMSPVVLILTILAGVAALLAGAYFYFLGNTESQAKKKDQNDEESKCDGIKSLLEQKKKELEEMLLNLPKEKVKEFAAKAALNKLKKKDSLRETVEAGEELFAKYEKSMETIELLEQRFSLCELSLPGTDEPTYKGTIVEKSLVDPEILKNIKITKTHYTDDWVLHDVLVNEKQIAKLSPSLADGPWFMHFWKDDSDDTVVVFKDAKFKVRRRDRGTWGEAIDHGRALGIPDEQLDFKPTV